MGCKWQRHRVCLARFSQAPNAVVKKDGKTHGTRHHVTKEHIMYGCLVICTNISWCTDADLSALSLLFLEAPNLALAPIHQNDEMCLLSSRLRENCCSGIYIYIDGINSAVKHKTQLCKKIPVQPLQWCLPGNLGMRIFLFFFFLDLV